MKRAILTIAALIVAIAMIFPISSISASAASVPVITLEEANAAANWARSQVGSTAYHTRCPQFVRDCFYYGAGYSYWSVDGNARTLADRWMVCNSDSNIPIGALVFYDYITDLGEGLRNYGHVGIYVGDGQVVSALKTVTIHGIHSLNNCNYIGWGTYRNYQAEYNHGIKSISVCADKVVDYGESITFGFGADDKYNVIDYYWLVIQDKSTKKIIFEGSVPANTHTFEYSESLNPGEYTFNVYIRPRNFTRDISISVPFKVKINPITFWKYY